ncbi:DNA repair protein REV1 [Salarias fasciatus]|uniref:DNA repair protein REV1 n=1 Tax=Salarias fasciatus TaxID=181472 RepID=A0A672H399_SALFA|nr:DNA repair protein REV1 [Salarias fasciatus]
MSRDGWMKKRANASGDNGWAERGGYMAAKKSKLDEQFKLDAPREKQRDGSYTSIFSGVAIYVNGYTDPSADELRRLMMLHGGQFHVYYSRSKTTHIIANNLPNNKIQELKGEKVIRPEWITDSVKAGRLLPYLQYQLYAKQKGPLLTGLTLRQASDAAGPSLQPGAHQKLHLALRSVQPWSHEQNNAVPVPGHSRPQCGQHGAAAARCVHPQSGHSPASLLITDPRHRSPLQPHPLSNPSCTKLPHKSPHPAALQEADLKINGLLQTSVDIKSHSKMNEMQKCVKEDACSPRASKAVKAAALTNGHAHLVNGALKPEDRPSGREKPSGGKELHDCRVRGSQDKAQNPLQPQAQLDPYEFPHSPPKPPDASSAALEPSGSAAAAEQTPPPPPPACHQAPEPRPPSTDPQPRLQVDASSEKSLLSAAPLSPSPVRLNGSHHKAFPSDPDPVSPGSTARPHPPSDKSISSSSSSSAQLLEQTGGLISEFYSHSRLHQISTWRTGFSEYVNELNSKRKGAASACFPGRDRLRRCVAQRSADAPGASAPGSVKSCILHVDMDCFFVSVGIRHRPELKGKPVAVTSNRGQARVPVRPGANAQVELQYYQRKYSLPQPESAEDELHSSPSQQSPDSHCNGLDQDSSALSMAEIASCSYEARQAGVRNGMFFGKAKQLCPSLQSVPYDFEAYKEVALSLYETLAGYTHDIEALSCDEVLIDGSALLAEVGGSPEDLASAIRADIKEKTGCCASVGMGSNILLARLATRKAKPDGQYLLKSEEVDDFIRDLPVTSLPGVGPVMGRKLAATGVRSCGDLQQVSLSHLQKKFGPRTGQTLFRFCRGLDDRPVRYEKERKSVSAEMNYNIRFTKVDEAECFLKNLSMEVQKRLQEARLRGRRVTLKLMVRKAGAPLEPAKYGGHGICDNLARTVMLTQSTDSGQQIAAAVIKLFHAMKLQVQDLRGVGIQVQCLEGSQSTPQGTRSIKQMFYGQGSRDKCIIRDVDDTPQENISSPAGSVLPPADPVPGPSRTPKTSRKRLNLSIEVPSPSQVDRSVLEALPSDLREQVEQSWMKREGRPNHCHSPAPAARPPSPPRSPLTSAPALYTPPAGTLVLQLPDQLDSAGILLELPSFSQVDPDVFAALPKELQEELKSAYSRVSSVQPPARTSNSTAEPKNPLLQLKQCGVGLGVGRVKRRYKRKNAVSPVKSGPSPLKRRHPAAGSPAKSLPLPVKTENNPSTSAPSQNAAEPATNRNLRPSPALAGACELTDIKTLLREWVTTMTDPMEEDILQVVKYCTELIEDKDLEKLDLIIKYMKRIMQQSLESVWSMAFDFILDNVQVIMQQAYGSTLKIA